MVEVKWVREARRQTTGGQQRRLARKGEHEPPQVVAHPRAPWPGGPGGWVQEANNSYLLLCAWRNRGALAEPPKIFSFVRLVLPNLSESEATGGGANDNQDGALETLPGSFRCPQHPAAGPVRRWPTPAVPGW